MAPDDSWPAVLYEEWGESLDTVHAHTQVLGKVAATLAPPEPQLQHAALRLTARGWETAPLPAPDGSGVLVVALDLHSHEAIAEHSRRAAPGGAADPESVGGGGDARGAGAVSEIAGPVAIDPTPQEVPWTVPLDEDAEHATYDTGQVASYLPPPTRAALVLAAFRAPYRGRSTPVHAWWGSFDLAVSLFSGAPADPPSDRLHHAQRDGLPGGRRRLVAGRTRATPRRRSTPTPTRRRRVSGRVASRPRRRAGSADLGVYVLDWDDVRASEDPQAFALSVRPLGVPTRLPRLRLGREACGERRGSAAAGRVGTRPSGLG